MGLPKRFLPAILLIAAISFFFEGVAPGQATYTAQLRGTVTDETGAVIRGAKVTITDQATNISSKATTNDSGLYIFTALRPTTYMLRIEAPGFEVIERKNVVLAVAQQASLDATLRPAVAAESVEVVDTAPLLDTGSASLGTDVTNEFVSRMPLSDRNINQLVYLSAGVTQLNNGEGYPYGTDYSSNGQRYSTSEVRLDGNLTTGPEQGEGATTNVSYTPSPEVIQEFKVQNNSFSAEYGSNGGTVVNVLMKSGTNNFHGSGWWFGRRPELNANDFFSNRYGVPKADSTRDQYGFSIGGPIVKGKTFFLFDLEKVRQNDKSLISARVPTEEERRGDFRNSMTLDDNGNLVPVQIYNPFNVGTNDRRRPFTTKNVIDPSLIDQVGQNLVNAYPMPTGPLDPATMTNFAKGVVVESPSTQFDVKIDHNFTDKTRLMGRYSQNISDWNSPGLFFDSITSTTKTRNIVLEHTWAMKNNMLLTNRFGVDRYHMKNNSERVDPAQYGLPELLTQANGIVRMPEIDVENYQGLNPQCCVDTINGHTQYIYSSAMNWVVGKHALKFGGEQRLFLNNFWQPDYGTGLFNFGRTTTAPDPFGDNTAEQGNAIASMLLGFPEYGQLNIKRPVATKSKATSFYIQDDWKVTPRLTLNVGLRYEWTTPYTERHNLIQFSNFNGDSGVTVDLTPPATDVDGNPIVDGNGNPVDLSKLGLGPTTLKGTTVFPTGDMRNVPVDRNNWAPRVGFAFRVTDSTVLRGGAGVFYGLSNATNFQYPGTAFRKDAIFHFTLDGINQYATLTNLFPTLAPGELPQLQGTKYGALANWGFGNQNDLGTIEDRNPEIYQFNFGVQQLLPWDMVISADYSGNRSTHLPWGGPTRNRNIMPTAAREACDSACQATLVANPFYEMFQPGGVFNEPDSQYSNPYIPLGNLLRPYPQFDTAFEALPLMTASSWYHGLLFRFQKRPSHGLSFEGNYTLSKATDDSSFGANYWIYFGGSGLGSPQDMNNLKAEHSVGANDTRHRFVLATVYDLPFGKGRMVGGNLHPLIDALVGGWSINALLTLQSGQPIPFAMAESRIADGLQRPNISCSPSSGMSLHDLAFSSDPNASYFNASCFGDPGDQMPGNAPRFSSDVRGPGLKNIDMGFFKDFPVKEGMKFQVRAEFFNLTNTVRFATPSSFYGDSVFGKVTSQANSPRRTQIGVRFEF